MTNALDAMEGFSLPPDVRRGPTCGIVAVAIAAGVSFAEAEQALAAVRKRRGNWRGRTGANEREWALTLLRVPFTRITLPRKMPLETFIKFHAWPRERYMVTTTGHVQMVFNECVADQFGVVYYPLFQLRRKRIKSVWRID